ncbi:unnamed protein product [Malus baccata var. baccata]
MTNNIQNLKNLQPYHGPDKVYIGDGQVLVLVYVDDIIVTGPSSSHCNAIISKLSAQFPVKDLGDLHYFLGLKVQRSSSEYRSIVGAPQYLTWTQLDLSFDVNPKINMGFCIFLGPSIVSWSAKKQHTVARSSTEAEYRYLAHNAAEITWICQLFTDIGFQLPVIPQIWRDNVSAIALASNPVFHALTKHVEIDYHYIRELVVAHLLRVQFVCSEDQLADIHTMSLPQQRFLHLRSKLSFHPSLFSLKGCDKDKIVTHCNSNP